MQILNDLDKIIIDSKETLEGNAIYCHKSFSTCVHLYEKQVNLFWCGKQAKTKICEIGFNAGHSAMLLLLGRDKTPLEFTIFDLNAHLYTQPCLSYIASQFPYIKFMFIHGDSTVNMPLWCAEFEQNIGTYDVIHIDGGHLERCIASDMKYADMLLKVNGILIIDDIYVIYINNIVNEYLSTGRYEELDVLKTKCYPHRIIRKIEPKCIVYY